MSARLDPAEITETVATLHKRIQERFPDANLVRVCGGLVEVSRKAVLRTAWIREPILSLRIGVSVLILAFVGILLGLGLGAAPAVSAGNLSDFLQSTEAVLSSMVILGAVAFFLVTLEQRVKRMRALNALHELRDMAHIVDMHQLTKDPVPPAETRPDTESSPYRGMSPFELSRYLDYCSEMLALTSKIGALYGNDLNDPVVLAGIDGLQGLIDGLTQKIWYKLTIIGRVQPFAND